MVPTMEFGFDDPCRIKVTAHRQFASRGVTVACADTTGTKAGVVKRSVSCDWNSAHRFFQCNIKTPRGVRTGRANPYPITAFENVGAGSVRAPAVRGATTSNPETVFLQN
jgi:hypothetical protein